MTIIAFYEARGTRAGSDNDSYEREYDRAYIAISNSAFDAEPEIWRHPKCPVINRRPEWDNLAKCDKRAAKLRKSGGRRWIWDVNCHFSSVQLGEDKNDDPTQDPAEIEIDTELQQEERYFNRAGKLTTNTAGDLVKYQVEVPRSDIQIQKNISIYDSWIGDIAGIVNNSPVRIKNKLWDTGTLKVVKVHIGKTEFRNKKPFEVAKVSMRHKKEGWASTALNVGYYELIPDPTGKIKDKAGKPALIRWRCLTGGTEGEPETQPVFLDKKGRRPMMKVAENGIEKLRPKCPLELKDIIVLSEDFLVLYDFKKLPLA